ncbi:hypothetical protein GLAREA_05317 [Glarea lozoyensis ATCC 20868]|uniref:Uncharacterized protein n=2 Tax=Glarea lozoyensis TaxID=101852 RepID=S3DFQ7_GLAL2|nr:uncharacterized protein GLAREA_05317 [Glarea lozoyensis ATCC 20868]EHK97979.1 hypothetical protein M7I_6211 [Glarea lozoyensis 74030]EPE35979.1 hypothetical protein GLAREA_05317 [Glarea lozoyensis ATCC 20868]
MGLPLFITPVEPEVVIEATEKTAAGPRSAIRRQRTLRGPNARAAILDSRRRRILSTVADVSPEEYEIWEMQRTSPPADVEAREIDITHRRGAQRLLAEAERLRESLGIERRNRSNEPDGPSMMPPVPETRDYYGIRGELAAPRQPSDLQRLARNPAPTPPYTETDLAFLARRGSGSPRPSSLAAALSLPGQPLNDNESRRRRIMEEHANRTARRPLGRRPIRSTLSDRIVAASREIGLGSTERPRPFADGLGDRDRSLSPEGDSAWDTLRASIAPDPQPPSVGSSFASAAAAASSSTGSAVTSAGTSMTSAGPSEGAPGTRDCDMSDSASNTDEDEEDMYGLQEFHRSSGEHLRRSYAEMVSSRPRQQSRNDSSADEVDWAAMRRIITSLVERDDVPEEWWASAGLTRNLRHEPMS